MRSFTAALTSAVAIGLLAGCAGGNLGSVGSPMPGAANQSHISPLARAPISLVPSWMTPAGVARLHLDAGSPVRPDKGKPPKTANVIWASQFDTGTCGTSCENEGFVNGYPNPDTSNVKDFCDTPAYYVNGVGTDPKGYLAIPAYFSGSYYTINVYDPATTANESGNTCPALDYSVEDTTGQPAAAASLKGTTSWVVGEIANYTSEVGDVVVCTPTACGTPVTNTSITSYVAGVAVDNKGDCWASAETMSFASSILVYWAGCTGSGVVVSGYKNAYYGGLFFDKNNNLGSIDLSGNLYIYKPSSDGSSVSVVLGPVALKGESLFGNLNSAGNTLSVGDFANSDVDVYKYSDTKVKYSYSISNGFTGGDNVESGIQGPTNTWTHP